MHRPMIGSLLGLSIVLAAATAASPAVAGEVYQWKDAKGVTHYSQTPPPSGTYKQRAIASSGEAMATQVAALAVVNPQCVTARKNIEVLNGKASVMQDSDGDGKPDRTLTDIDRANQLELAQAAIKATCPPIATAP